MGPVSRRSFVQLGASVAGLGLAVSACGLQAPWVRPRIPRIGYGSYGPRETFAKDYVDPFLQGMRDLGYVEGENIAIEWRFTSGSSNDEFRRVAEELVRQSVDVIVAPNSVGIGFELKRATSAIPILANMLAPVESGLVASLAHPGGNITGLSADVPGGWGKYVELLHEVVPRLERV